LIEQVGELWDHRLEKGAAVAGIVVAVPGTGIKVFIMMRKESWSASWKLNIIVPAATAI
jgi:hypothetical protein